MEYFSIVRWFNLGCALTCFWNYAAYGNFIIICIGALNLAVFIFGKQLLEFWLEFKKAVKK